jgi:hypothetical protein
MVRKMDEHLHTCLVILGELSHKPARYTPLMKVVVDRTSRWRSCDTLRWLLSHRMVERERGGVYEATPLGLRFYEVLGDIGV